MTAIKNITRIAFKQDPEKGERGALPRITEWEAGKTYYSGAAGELYADFVYYNGVYYRCLTTHSSTSSRTPYALVQGSAGIWSIESNFQFVATKIAFIGQGADGWTIDNGVIRHSSGKIALNADGSFSTSNGKYVVDADGNLTALSGTFAGFLRIPFVNLSSDMLVGGEYVIGENVYINCSQPAIPCYPIRLPNDPTMAGTIVTLWDSPIKTRSSGWLDIVSTANIYHPKKNNTTYYGVLPAHEILANGGGLIQLLCLPNGAWQVMVDTLLDETIT